MGDAWYQEELTRQLMIEKLEDKVCILFPQTLFYSNTELGRRLRLESVKCYANRKKIVLTARETTSYENMKKYYPGTDIILTPDIVLTLDLQKYGISLSSDRKGVLFIFREDKEQKITKGVREKIIEIIKESGMNYTLSDMTSSEVITAANREKIVVDKLQQFSKAKLVITDRLHGMIFSAITATPCIVFGNYNHKIKQSYSWLKQLDYILYCDTMDDFKDCLHYLLKHQSSIQNYPYEEMLRNFKPLIEKVERI